MIRLESVVIVEGKYDKIALENVIDATFIVTNGFGVYKDKAKRELIKALCKRKGAVIITDSDNAGNQIRAFLKNLCGTDNIKNVYLPQIPGKEKRKVRPSKQGYLGAEGMDKQVIIDALYKSGVLCRQCDKAEKITKTDLYITGLSGIRNAGELRESFCDFLGLPRGMSSSAFLDALNAILSKNDFYKEAEKWQEEQAKN